MGWARRFSPPTASRTDPNFATTWAIAATVPLFWIIVYWIPVLPLVALFAPLSYLLARSDAKQFERVFGRRSANPLLAVPSPIVYLVFRHLRGDDLRSGKPLWAAIGVLPFVFFFAAMADIGAYAAWVRGG